MKSKQYAVLAVCAAAAGAFLVFNTPLRSEAGNSQATKLEGAWINQTENGIRGLVTFAPSDPSGRSAAFRAKMVWPPALLASVGLEAVTEEVGEGFVTGPDTSKYTAIWYGLAGGQIVLIFLDNTTLTHVSPTQITLQHTVDVYLATADADNDGYPDPGSTPVQTFEVNSSGKRVAH